MSFCLSRDVLVGHLLCQWTYSLVHLDLLSHKVTTHQVHTVSGTRYKTGVRHCVHRIEFLKRHRSVQIMNRCVVDSTESTVDLTDELVDTCSEILILFDILSRGNGQLDQNTLRDVSASCTHA